MAANRIVILGGGAGGIELAIRLSRRMPRGALTLVDKRATHLWKPRLHEVATGLLLEADEQVSYAYLAAQHGFHFVLGAIGPLSAEKGEVEIRPVPRTEERIGSGQPELIGERTLGFEQAVIAIGSVVNDFGTPGVAEHCFTVDTPEEAGKTYGAIMAAAHQVQAGASARLRVAIVGAGATGVELAAELRHASRSLARLHSLIGPEQLDLTIIEMGPRVLAGLDEAVAESATAALEQEEVVLRLNTKVERAEAGRLHLSNGETIEADIMVWASGTKGQEVLRHVQGAALEKGRLKVDRMLRVLGDDGAPLKGVFAIGDATQFPAGNDKPLPATAQVAHQQGRTLARSLAGQVQGRPPIEFHYKEEGSLVSLGRGRAVGEVVHRRGRTFLEGATAKLAYVSLYRLHLVLLFGWWRTGLFTVSQILRQRAMPTFKVHWR